MLLIRRCLHTGGPVASAAKSNLAKLRKRTGISFNHCRKALNKFDQDLDKVSDGWYFVSMLAGTLLLPKLFNLFKFHNGQVKGSLG